MQRYSKLIVNRARNQKRARKLPGNCAGQIFCDGAGPRSLLVIDRLLVRFQRIRRAIPSSQRTRTLCARGSGRGKRRGKGPPDTSYPFIQSVLSPLPRSRPFPEGFGHPPRGLASKRQPCAYLSSRPFLALRARVRSCRKRGRAAATREAGRAEYSRRTRVDGPRATDRAPDDAGWSRFRCCR